MKNSKKLSIGIMGNGVVGSTLLSWFPEALCYDVDVSRRKNEINELEEKAEYIIGDSLQDIKAGKGSLIPRMSMRR